MINIAVTSARITLSLTVLGGMLGAPLGPAGMAVGAMMGARVGAQVGAGLIILGAAVAMRCCRATSATSTTWLCGLNPL